MDLSKFIHARRGDWRRLEEVLARVEGSGLRTLDDDQAAEFGRLYRRAASDLNQAQTFVSGAETVQYLNDLVARCYFVIYGHNKLAPWAFIRFLLLRYPAVFRRYRWQVALATAITFAGVAFGALATRLEPEAAQLYLMPPNFPTIRPERDQDRPPAMSTGELGQLSTFYFTNNLRVCLIVFAMGLTLGIGTTWLLFQNGLLLGVLATVFADAGHFKSFCAEVLPHGMVEFPAILISGAAGFVLAEGIFRARPWPRVEELARLGKEAAYLVAGCVPLLLAAAFLEAVVARAPAWMLGNDLKLAVAGLVLLGFMAYVLLPGWKGQAQEQTA